MRQLQNLFGALLLLVTGLTLCGCGNGDNALEEIINGGGGSSSSDPSGVSYVAYTASGTTATPTTKTLADGEYILVNDEIAELTGDKPYVVNSDVTIDHDVTISTDAELIICDGKTLTINGKLNDNNASLYTGTKSLSLYGQTSETGKLIVTFPGTGTATSAIKVKDLSVSGVNIISSAKAPGGWAIKASGEFNLYHGSVDARNYEGTIAASAECIDTYKANVYDGATLYCFGTSIALRSSSSINNYGGTITAEAGFGDTGIGGKAILSASVNIYGGKVTATGGNAKSGSGKTGGIGIYAMVTISGGTLYATGGNSDGGSHIGNAGIYFSPTALDYKGGNVVISGGTNLDSWAVCSALDGNNLPSTGGTIKNSTGEKIYYDAKASSAGSWQHLAGTYEIASDVSVTPITLFAIRIPKE